MAGKAEESSLNAFVMELAAAGRHAARDFSVAGRFDRLRIAEDIHGQPGSGRPPSCSLHMLEMALEFLLCREFEIAVDVVEKSRELRLCNQFVPR